ncbi:MULTISPECIES: hypothetical protein [Bacillaceae]|uniref:hypothetical protein n=1 Tax=Bacillaceae TaxID=186817 RepID=UPI001E4BBB6B|nr:MULTISPECIES: hypothetical protein [Bacillaceae]MCE4048742.1 hypothetical protein [Bacillus sp. Au-Bac7]MCM3032970.1 hypothetical protein [Niallia sp. MER 6]
MKKGVFIFATLVLVALVVFIFNKLINTEKIESEVQFDSEAEALEYAKDESPYIVDFISQTKLVDSEKMVIYKFKKDEAVGIGTGTLVWKNKKVSWYKNGNDVIISDKNNNTNIIGDVESYSGKKFKLYAGITNSKNIKIETETDSEISPHIDDNSGLYYLLVPSLRQK